MKIVVCTDYKSALSGVLAGNAISNAILFDTNEELFVDEYVRNSLHDSGLIDEEGNFDENYINDLKDDLAEKNDLDVNNEKDLKKLEGLVSKSLNARVETEESKAKEKRKAILELVRTLERQMNRLKLKERAERKRGKRD